MRMRPGRRPRGSRRCTCQRSTPRYCFDCHHGHYTQVHCGKVVCARHLKFHDDTAAACARTLGWGCFDCILHQRNVRDTLVREVERNLLLGAQGPRRAGQRCAHGDRRARPRLVRTRPGTDGERRARLCRAGGATDRAARKAQLRAKKDKRGRRPGSSSPRSTVRLRRKQRRVSRGALVMCSLSKDSSVVSSRLAAPRTSAQRACSPGFCCSPTPIERPALPKSHGPRSAWGCPYNAISTMGQR